MNVNAQTRTVNVVCPCCHATNGVPEDRLEESPSCGACKRPLFEGRPVELAEADLERHLKVSGLPIVVDFWAPWCGPSRARVPMLERAARELEPRVRFARVDTDEDQQLAMRFGIPGIPTIAIYRNGNEVARISGVMDAAWFIAWVRANV